MKNYSFSEISIEWHKYLMDNVIHESYYIEFTKAKFPYIINLKNIIESGINISTKWGIITLEFKTYSQKQEFSSFIKLIIMKTNSHAEFILRVQIKQ